MKQARLIGIAAFCSGLIFGCGESTQTDNASGEPSKSGGLGAKTYLYVASGTCYSGYGIATFSNTSSSNMIYRIETSSGQRDATLVDYNQLPSEIGDSPVGFGSADGSNIFVLIENATATTKRRVEKFSLRDGARTVFNKDQAILNSKLRDLLVLPSGDMLLSRTKTVEKIASSGVRAGTKSFIKAPAGVCATSMAGISKLLTLNNGNIVFFHASSGQNRFGIVSAAGYVKASDCKAAQLAPSGDAYPTSAIYDRVNNKLIVAYAGFMTTPDVNSIYVYSIDEANNTISNPQKIYDVNRYPATYNYLLYGISAMTFDMDAKSIYIATAVDTNTRVSNYRIEKFSYHPEKIGVASAEVLSRVGSAPFYSHGYDTKCISALAVAN